MNRYEKSILFKLNVAKVLYVIVAIVNLAMPLYNDLKWTFSIFQLIVCVIWLFGMLAAIGIFCTNTHEIKGDVVIYEQNTSPVIIALGICRIIEAFYYYVFHQDEINWIAYGILIFIDLFYLIFILIDKANYEYARQLVDTDEVL